MSAWKPKDDFVYEQEDEEKEPDETEEDIMALLRRRRERAVAEHVEKTNPNVTDDHMGSFRPPTQPANANN